MNDSDPSPLQSISDAFRALKLVHRHDVDGVIIYTTDGTVEYANESAENLFQAPDGLVGLNYFEMLRDQFDGLDVTVGDTRDHQELGRRAFDGDHCTGRFELSSSEQGVRQIEVRYSPLHAENDKIVGLIASYRDVSEEAFHNENLRVQSEFLGTVLNTLDEGIIVFNDSLTTRLENAKIRSILNYIGRPANLRELAENSGLVAPAELIRNVEFARRRRETSRNVYICKTAMGLRRVEIALNFTVIEGRELICVCRDVTQTQELQQLRLLADIGKLGAEKRRFDGLANQLLTKVFDSLQIDVAVLAILGRERLRPVCWRGVLLEPDMLVDPMENYYVRKAVKEMRPVEGDGGEWDGGEMTGLHYVVPLVASGRTLGTLHLGVLVDDDSFDSMELTKTSPLNWEDPVFLKALGAYVAAAIQNAQLFERHEAERARLRTLIQRIPDGVVVFNTRGDVLLRNDAADEIFEVELQQLNSDSRPYRVRSIDGKVLARAEWPFFRAVRSGEAVSDQLNLEYADDRKKVVEITVIPIASAKGHITSFLGTVQDITERNAVDKRREEFLSIASHELRNPLTPLMGFLQMARHQVERGDAIDQSLLERSENQVRRLARLIEVLLDVTRIETGRMYLDPATFDLNEHLQKVIGFWSAHPRGSLIHFKCVEGPVSVHVDATRFEQVITNLIDNALKHSEARTPIWIETSVRANRAVISITDEGEGIPADKLAHLFDRYFQVRGGRHRSSMGLGLYISREIIEQHGGTIQIESSVGVGTLVRIELPLRTH